MNPPANPRALIKAMRARGLTPVQQRLALILLAVNGPANAWTFVEHVQAHPEEEPMKTSPSMKKLVTQLCTQHGVDLAAPKAYLKLKLPGDAFMPLIIERLGRRRLCVAHYYVCDEYSGELAADPDVEILVTPQGDWVPIAVQMPAPFGYRCYAELDSDDQRIARWTYAGAHQGQGDLACFVNQWAKNLEAQGFLTRATVVAARPEP
ncbi:MAG: hypothetical protein KKA73_10770, partial [Chloroflexi bacterium]|nr:hypothetical protein [Chloroflexota bacterium]